MKRRFACYVWMKIYERSGYVFNRPVDLFARAMCVREGETECVFEEAGLHGSIGCRNPIGMCVSRQGCRQTESMKGAVLSLAFPRNSQSCRPPGKCQRGQAASPCSIALLISSCTGREEPNVVSNSRTRYVHLLQSLSLQSKHATGITNDSPTFANMCRQRRAYCTDSRRLLSHCITHVHTGVARSSALSCRMYARGGPPCALAFGEI